MDAIAPKSSFDPDCSMKTISREDALALNAILRRIGYDPSQPPGFGPFWRTALADLGEKAGLGEVAQVNNYHEPVMAGDGVALEGSA